MVDELETTLRLFFYFFYVCHGSRNRELVELRENLIHFQFTPIYQKCLTSKQKNVNVTIYTLCTYEEPKDMRQKCLFRIIPFSLCNLLLRG